MTVGKVDMGWFDWFNDGERSDGETGKVDDVDLKIKVNDEGKISDILVSRHGEKATHDHIYNADKPGASGVKSRVKW